MSCLGWTMLESMGVGSSVGSVGSANSSGGSIIRTGRVGVSSEMANSWYLGHFRDHAGWLPWQKGHFGSAWGHLLGACWLGQVGQMGRLGQFDDSWPR